MRAFCYVQQLSGVGHMVRTQEIAQAIAQRHQVTVMDGGRELAFPPTVQRLRLPRLARREGVLTPLQPGQALAQALQLRSQSLQNYLATQRPDLVLVEHFPFSKWELADEIDTLLQAARRCRPGVKVVCSLRDIAPPTRYEQTQDYAQQVVDRLNRQFDALLVHADPELCSIDDFFPALADIGVPVVHTGIVAPQPLPAGRPASPPGMMLPGDYIVASIGGGADDGLLLQRVTHAWQRLKAQGELGTMTLLLFTGLAGHPSPRPGALSPGPDAIHYMGFDHQFRHWLQGARLSIRCAGYNTCASLLVAGVPALLAPNLAMSDQLERARMLARRGIAACVPPATAASDPLPAMILEALDNRPAPHSINVEGAANSARYLEALVSGLHIQ